jgi:glycosyltransferase involved in cell wall biosynthesis
MNVGIDVSILQRGGGVANYIYHLLEGLKQVKPEYQYKLFFNSVKKANLSITCDFFKVKSTRIPNRILQLFWLYLRFPPVEWFLGDIDVFLSPAHSPVYAYCPPARNWVVTVHDLFTFKLNYDKKTQEKEMIVLRRIELNAERVIAVSNSTRNDLLEIIPSLDSRVVVIPEGVDEKFYKERFSSNVLIKYGIQTPYILYLGAADSHKNLPSLVKIFKRLSEIMPHSMVFAGRITERYKAVIKLTNEINLQDRVVFTGAIDENDISSIYKGADLLVLPSLYEGFGLVLLEAMASGTPVVASNVSSIPEVVGDAAKLFDPYDVEDIYDTIYTVASDSNLREKMRKEGIERARLFSWKKMAQETLRIYEEVAGS